MADLWRDRARQPRWLLRPGGDARPHYVVCGQEALAFHLVNTLLGTELSTGSVRVTVIVPHRRRLNEPDIRSIRGIRLIKSDRLDEDTFRAAGLAGAAGLALMRQDDVGNIHAALCAQAVEPGIRVVLRMFNGSLANGVRQLLPDCAVLSDASMAAPAFVAAALGEVTPTYFRHGGRTLHVARRVEVRPEQVVCGLADTRERNDQRVLPEDEDEADLVLAEATGQPSDVERTARRVSRDRQRRNPLRVFGRAVRSFVTRKIGIATMVVLVVIAVFGFLLSFTQPGVTLRQGLYLAVVITLSGADAGLEKNGPVQVIEVVLNLAGLALVPLITAAVVDGIVNARLALTADKAQPRREDHVVVVGLGNVGTRVMAQLHDLGIEVVAIDKDPNARGVPLAHRLGIPLIIGDAAQEETLVAASVAGCRALLVLSTDDVSNLQAALNGRSVKEDLRVVLRLFDGDFASRIQRAFNINISRSVSYLAAPSFAAALLNRAVIATIPVERHVLLIAEVPVVAGALLVGRPVGAAGQPRSVRVIALTRAGQSRPLWSPGVDERLAAGDRLTVVARRAGLSWLLKQAGPPTDPDPDTGPARGPLPTQPAPPAGEVD
ncbi:potassium channel family protein [Micromonospora zhanjiangensis]|uniref:Potassium channel family protein n=1 Tax=Micromonospora zhanjiangensis TaxID=1522057 RepID=A0ABV8KEL4_9ACTN